MPLDQVQIDIIRAEATMNPDAQWTSDLVLQLIARSERQRDYLLQANEAIDNLSEGFAEAQRSVATLADSLKRAVAAVAA